MESLGFRVYTGYNWVQISSDPSERWYHVVPAPAASGNACSSVLARPEDRLVQSSNEYTGVMKCNCCTGASLILTLGALLPGMVGKGGLVAVGISMDT